MLESFKLGSPAWAWYHKRTRAGIPNEADWLVGQAGCARDGTVVRFGLRRVGERFIDARYEVFGCPAAIAAAAWVADRMVGTAPAAAASLCGREVAEALDLPVEKTGVVLVVEDALRNALTAADPLGLDGNSARGD